MENGQVILKTEKVLISSIMGTDMWECTKMASHMVLGSIPGKMVVSMMGSFQKGLRMGKASGKRTKTI